MEYQKPDYYLAIQHSLVNHFGFLNDLGFSDFKAYQLAYEFHFEAKNSKAKIDISFDAISSSPIWIQVNGYYVDHLEPENEEIKKYKDKLNQHYEGIFQQYLKTNKTKYLKLLNDEYAKFGKKINDDYLKEISELIKRNIFILDGELEQLKLASEKFRKKKDSLQEKENIKQEIYTLEFDFCQNGDYSAFEEFKTLEEAKIYLKDNNEIKKYRIFDCHKNEIETSKE
ncbi:MAG: hypothetical protein ABIP95_04730 [Pelobium sp.]